MSYSKRIVNMVPWTFVANAGQLSQNLSIPLISNCAPKLISVQYCLDKGWGLGLGWDNVL